MSSEYVKFNGKSRFLAKLCNKSHGIKSHKQRIESDREREAYIGLRSLYGPIQMSMRSFNAPIQMSTRSLSEIKRFSTLGEIARFKEAK